MRKFRNKPVVDPVYGRFDSTAEYKRWNELLLLEKAGDISHLERQITYTMVVNGDKICAFRPDFRYFEGNELVVEDFKSPATVTPIFKLKAKLLKAIYGIDLRITMR